MGHTGRRSAAEGHGGTVVSLAGALTHPGTQLLSGVLSTVLSVSGFCFPQLFRLQGGNTAPPCYHLLGRPSPCSIFVKRPFVTPNVSMLRHLFSTG